MTGARCIFALGVTAVVAVFVGLRPATSRIPDSLVVLDRSNVDFGIAQPDSTLEHIFHIANYSKVPLVLEGIKTSCSCLVPELERPEREPILPGQAVAVPLRLRAGSAAGSIGARAIITYRAAAADASPMRYQHLELSAKATVESPLIISPSSIDFGQLGAWSDEQPAPQLVAIVGRNDARVDIAKVSTSTDSIVAELIDTKDQGRRHTIEVTLNPQRAPGDQLTGFVMVTMVDSKQPKEIIEVRASYSPPIESTPKYVVIGANESGTVTKELLFTCSEPVSLRMAESQSSSIVIHPPSIKKDESRQFLVRFTVAEPSLSSIDSFVKVTVDKRTNGGSISRTLHVPVFRFQNQRGEHHVQARAE